MPTPNMFDEEKPKKYGVRYQTVMVYFDYPVNRNICDACGKSKEKGEIKGTQGHHWGYAYKTDTVKKNPKLALENRSEFCYYDHQIADAVRTLAELTPEQLIRASKVAILMPIEMQRKFTVICKQFITYSQHRAKSLSEFVEEKR